VVADGGTAGGAAWNGGGAMTNEQRATLMDHLNRHRAMLSFIEGVCEVCCDSAMNDGKVSESQGLIFEGLALLASELHEGVSDMAKTLEGGAR